MSIAAIAWSWKQDLRPTEKFILIAISDHANDEDFTCWPSLTHLEKKTGFNRSTIWRTIDCLVKTGHIGRVGQHPSGATLYKVMVGAQSTQVQTATSLGAGCNVVGAHSNKVGAQDTPNHKNHHESSITIMSGLPPDVAPKVKNNQQERLGLHVASHGSSKLPQPKGQPELSRPRRKRQTNGQPETDYRPTENRRHGTGL